MAGLVLAALPGAATGQDAEERIEELQRQMEALQRELDRLRSDVEERMPPPPDERVLGPREMASGNEQVSLSISGQVNRGILLSEDGEDTDVFFVDNDNSSTRVRFLGDAALTDDFSVGTVIEVQIESNSTAEVSQDDQDLGSVGFTDRKLEIFFDSDTYGRVWLGQGDTASNGTSEQDLSGTAVVGYSAINDLAGGLKFRTDDGTLSDVRIGDAMSNFDGLSRQDRLRYDTPSFAGLKASASAISDRRWDAALRYAREYDLMRVASAIAFAQDESNERDQLNGSISLLVGSGFLTGVNATFAAGLRDFDEAGRDDATFYYGKLGYRFDPFSFGETALAVDYYFGEKIADESDEADSFGVFAVQNVDDIATEFYAGYRLHQLDRAGVDFQDINAVLTGARVKF